MSITADDRPTTVTRFLWLELTTRCQLACSHCYNHSGPGKDHSDLTLTDWCGVLDQAADAGIPFVQFIGGEPTLHPGLRTLISHALLKGLQVEVYSNLVHVSDDLWRAFEQPGVKLATSWYSARREEHRRITGRDTWRQTRDNIAEAVWRGIPIRAGLVTGIVEGQDEAAALAVLAGLGVTSIRSDHKRGLGRAAADGVGDAAQLCGGCGHGRAAVLPDGQLAPCPMARWLTAGDVRREPLQALLGRVAVPVPDRSPVAECDPKDDTCGPPCEPQCDPGCDPSVE